MMHDFLDKLSVQELASYLSTIDNGLEELKDYLRETEDGAEFEKFLETTAETIVFLFTHFRKDD